MTRDVLFNDVAAGDWWRNVAANDSRILAAHGTCGGANAYRW